MRSTYPVSYAVAMLAAFSVHASHATSYFVSTTGSDANAGVSTGYPFKSLQKAFDVALPGDTIEISAGEYYQDFVTKRDGLAGLPITLHGPANAVVRGGGNARVVQINHSHIALRGFTVDGLFGDKTTQSGYRDKLVYVQGRRGDETLKGTVLSRLTLRNAGGECVRLRYFVQHSEIADNVVGPCGVHDFQFAAGGKNGEGVYVGTAPEQLTDGKNPTTDPDQSNFNWIHHNTIKTNGNECVDIKEASSGNVVEYNHCSGQRDPESGGLDARGSGNTFRLNEVYDNMGAGVRLGGDTSVDGTGNYVYGNRIVNNKAGGVKFQRTPQNTICGNAMADNVGGNAVGSYQSSFNPTQSCASGAVPVALGATGVSVIEDAGVILIATDSVTATAPVGNSSAEVTTSLKAKLSADTFVRGGSYANVNYGVAKKLVVKSSSEASGTRVAMLRFELNEVAPITQATLRFSASLSRSGNLETRVHATTTNWAETSVTWSNKPAPGLLLGSVVVRDSAISLYELDVTSYLREAQTAGLKAVSFAFTNPAPSDAVVEILSRENASGAAQLLIR